MRLGKVCKHPLLSLRSVGWRQKVAEKRIHADKSAVTGVTAVTLLQLLHCYKGVTRVTVVTVTKILYFPSLAPYFKNKILTFVG